ncbi:MAG: NAD(P)H-binding protein [bacterium]|nr:NAD(P)H-binding protein [bacterium]
MYVICGASGNIGRMVSEQLLRQGKKVRVIGRSAERLQPLVNMGAEAITADLMDTKTLTKAFTGATAVYTLIPPNMNATDFRRYQTDVGESLTRAIKDSGVKNVVNLSSVGAHLPSGTGVVGGLREQEDRLNGLTDVNVIHLRPTFFMENHLWQIDSIKNNGTMATTQNPDMPTAQIATSDVADHVVNHLTNLDFTGHTARELLGPADVTLNDVAAAIGQAIGKTDLKYVQVSYEDTRNHMINMGLSESVADNMVELYKAFNDGKMKPTETRTPENTTPTTINNFSDMFAKIYNG